MNFDDIMRMRLYSGQMGLDGLFGGGGGTWLKVVFLALLFAVPVFRPDQIRRVAWYRRAYFCFGASLILPSLSSLFLVVVATSGGPQGFGGNASAIGGTTAVHVLNALGPVLFGISVIYAVGAVVPGFIPPRSPQRPVGFSPSDSETGGPRAETPDSSADSGRS